MPRLIQSILEQRQVRDFLYKYGLDRGVTQRQKGYLAAGIAALAVLVAAVNLLRDPRHVHRIDKNTRAAEQAIMGQIGASTAPEPAPPPPPPPSGDPIPAGKPRPVNG